MPEREIHHQTRRAFFRHRKHFSTFVELRGDAPRLAGLRRMANLVYGTSWYVAAPSPEDTVFFADLWVEYFRLVDVPINDEQAVYLVDLMFQSLRTPVTARIVRRLRYAAPGG